MENFLTWRIALRRESRQATGLPDLILGPIPPLRHPALPETVALLLPNRDSLRRQLAALDTGVPTETSGEAALGLFLADPFLHPGRVAQRLVAAGVNWVVNLPSVAQQDSEFSQQLADVGLDGALEVRRLGELKDLGFRTLAVVSDAESARRAVAAAPEALVVLPRVADFAAGFPSFRQRGSAAAEVKEAAREAGWEGPLLGLAKQEEAEHEGLWPDALEGLLLRPAA